MNYGIPHTASTVMNAPAEVQSAFIRKVYGLFFLSVLVAVLAGAVAFQPSMAMTVLGLWPVLFIGEIILIFALSAARKTSGLNVALLCLFAVLSGALSGARLALINEVMPGLPMQAALLTISVFGGLTLYVFQTGKDFSFLGGLLFTALIGLLITGFVLFFLHIAALYMLYAYAGALIFAGFVLYDTSQIMNTLAPGDEVTGAINLYLDLINLFWFILRILGGNRR